MALGINTNVASINAQNQLNSSKDLNSEALERLSSGLRINSAADDAAGLAISTRFESQITGLETATRNANDGISLAQTAEGALDEVNSNLQRVRELAVQAANATNNASDREALNDEVQQRIEEINRIADTTAFNGLKVLDGSLETQDFQVGANAGETIAFDLSQGAKATQIGELASAEVDFTDVSGASFNGGGEFTIQVGDNDSETITLSQGDSAADIANTVESQNLQGISTVQAESEATFDFTTASLSGGSGGTYSLDVSLGDTTETISVDVSGSGDTLTAQEFADAVNDQGPEGLTATNDGGTITLSADSGENIVLENENLGGNVSGGGVSGGVSNSGNTYVGNVNIDASEELTITNDGDNSIAQLNNTDLAASSGGSVALTGSLDGVSVSTVDDANDAIKRADSALSAINEIRSGLGAIQNRFESTINNLNNSVENLSAANSRIRDADFAAETAKLAKSQVLQQAGISVLSQANQRPQQVLSLLQ